MIRENADTCESSTTTTKGSPDASIGAMPRMGVPLCRALAGFYRQSLLLFQDLETSPARRPHPHFTQKQHRQSPEQ